MRNNFHKASPFHRFIFRYFLCMSLFLFCEPSFASKENFLMGNDHHKAAGKKGAAKCLEKYGREFYAKIGKKGGESTRDTCGTTFYENIGKKGGHKGGQATKEKYGIEFYERIGAKGGARVKEIIAAGKKALAEAEEDKQNDQS